MTNPQVSAVLRTLRRGQIVTGTVTEIAPFLVTFVDIGGFTAYINIPELSWHPINHPSDVVTVGQRITAEVLDVDLERARVPLSLKALQPDPLLEFQQQIGKIVTGPVTRLASFGAYVRVEEVAHGFEGLLHESQLTEPLNVGDLVTVQISHVDVARRTIELRSATSER